MTALITETGKGANFEKEGHIMSPEVVSVYITCKLWILSTKVAGNNENASKWAQLYIWNDK